MKVIMNLKIKPEDFYDLIINSLIYDIEKNGKIISKDKLKSGFQYQKTLTNKIGKQGQSKVMITCFEYPYHYQASFYTTRGENIISYTIYDQKDGCQVEYTETYLSSQKLKKINHQFMNLFYTRHNHMKAKQMLKNMEQYILENKSIR